MSGQDYWHSSGERPHGRDGAWSREQAQDGYWQGTYRAPRAAGAPAVHDVDAGARADVGGVEADAGSRGDAAGARLEAQSAHGSVSARARRAYAAEALRAKDHVSAGLLAIFLGVFGVHKFYLGCNTAGFIMLAVSIIGGIFTFGLAAAVIEVIAIIEGVIYLTRTQTEFDHVYVLNQRDWF